MNGSLETVIATLTRRLQEKERMANELHGAANELRETINLLCAQAGLPPRYPGGDGGGSDVPSDAGVGGTATSTFAGQINGDAFYGKRQATAIREYLEMRRIAGAGPARPREIYDALRQGGFQYTAKDADTALVGMRALLRKMNTTFHKVPGGAYGLRSWYPHAQAAKVATAGKAEPRGDQQGTPTSEDDDVELPSGTDGKEHAAA